MRVNADGLKRGRDNVMRKYLSLLLVVLVLMYTITLVSCFDDTPTTTTTTTQKPKPDDPPVHVHTEVIDPEVEATCTETGLSEGKHCSECGEVLVSQQETPVVAHIYDDEYDDTCNECGHVRDAECAHTETEVIEGKDATCTEIGYTDGEKCKQCGEILSEQEVIPMLDHSYSSIATAPTCTEQGYTTYTCDCGDSYTDNYVDRIAHSFGEWVTVKETTATEEGLQERYCECGEKETQTIEKLQIQGSVGLEYKLNSNGKGYSVTGIGTCTDTNIIIPSEYNDLPVVSIGDYAFCDYNELTSVVIPDTVVSIGYTAFAECDLLTDIIIPNSVTTIDGYAFMACYSLSNIVIPDSVKSIGDGAFTNCTSLKSIDLSSVTSIGYYTFGDCTSLANIIIPDSVTFIGEDAFYACTSLTSIVVPYRAINIDKYDFEGCTNLTDIYSVELNSDGKTYTIKDYKGTTTDLVIISIHNGKRVTDIASMAFYACSNIVNLTIPSSISTIQTGAFSFCNKLESVTISETVTSVEGATFYGCANLTSVYLTNSIKKIDFDAFIDCVCLTNIYYSGSVAEWNAIEKGADWNKNTGSYRVYCNNGTISK